MGKRKFRIIALTVPLAIVAVVAWHALTSREQIYEGKPLTQWVDEYTVGQRADEQNKLLQLDLKIHWFGPSAVPQLIDMMDAKYPYLKRKLYEFVIPRNLTNQWITDLKRKAEIESYRPSSAAHFLYKIGPAAEPAIPALIRAAASTNQALCANAINALGAIHRQPEIVVPVLIRALSNRPWDAIFASGALGNFGTNATAAVPGLRDFATNGPQMIRIQAIESLRRIAPDSNLDLIVPFYIKIIETADKPYTSSAISALMELGPRAKEAVPALLDIFDQGSYNGQAAAYALRAIDPETAARVWPTFPRTANNVIFQAGRESDSRKEFIAQVQSKGDGGLSYLIERLEYSPQAGTDLLGRQNAAFMLGEMGQAARPAIPALRRAVADQMPWVRPAAEAALMKIEGKPLAPVIEQLKDISDPMAWAERAEVVAEFGPAAESAVPALIAAINTSHDTDTTWILPALARALGEIHRRPDLCVPVLIPPLDSIQLGVRQAAITALLAFGPDAKPALPKAIEAMNDLDYSVRMQATNFVKQLDPAAAKAGTK